MKYIKYILRLPMTIAVTLVLPLLLIIDWLFSDEADGFFINMVKKMWTPGKFILALGLALFMTGCETVHDSAEWPGVTTKPARDPSIVIDGQPFWINPTPTPEPITKK